MADQESPKEEYERETRYMVRDYYIWIFLAIAAFALLALFESLWKT